MSTKVDVQPASDRELVLCRIINAPRELVYRAWTDPSLVVKWFAPKPWTTARAELDVRSGGSSLVVMKSPEGKEFPNPGEDEGPGKTRYTARVQHWSAADREVHEKMGFHQGWGICTDQLEALVTNL